MKEIERKFLIRSPGEDVLYVPDLKNRRGEQFNFSAVLFIEQLYLERRAGLPEIRMRRILVGEQGADYPMLESAKYVLTVKTPTDAQLVREEQEMELALTPAIWESLIIQYPYVRKHRFEARTEEGYELVVDYIVKPQYIIAEVEFPDERSAGMWKPYAWMGREVTEDSAYKMRNLCLQ